MEKTWASATFYRWLCKIYRQGSAVGFFIKRRITPLAWFLMGLLVLSVLMGANLDQSVVFLFSALLFGLLSVGFIWAFMRGGKIAISREVSATGAVGEEIRYLVTATNIGRSALRGFHLKDSGDDPRPTEWEFIHLKEPGEGKRNPFDRFFAFLIDRLLGALIG